MASKYSFKALCDTYVQHLKTLKKSSAADVASLIKLYVQSSEWADRPAKSITAKQVTTLLRSIVEGGKGRTAGKLRSSLRAAYELALKAELDPTTPSEFISFGIEANPVASTAALSKFSKARDRALSSKEMAEVWKRLKVIPDNGPLPSLAARLVVLLGGQRAAQLMRVRISDGVDLEEGIITLMDKKGRREEPRIHSIPIVGIAANDVRNLIKRADTIGSDWLFASHKSHLGPNTLSHVILDISRDMIEKGLSVKPFQFSDIRRTAETMMASLGISERIRAQLQSHGLSGVQQRHYDKYEYMPEKQNALAAWHSLLESLTSDEPMKSNVTKLKAAA
jgi:integrase